jgi:hypothetical protein
VEASRRRILRHVKNSAVYKNIFIIPYPSFPSPKSSKFLLDGSACWIVRKCCGGRISSFPHVDIIPPWFSVLICHIFGMDFNPLKPSGNYTYQLS